MNVALFLVGLLAVFMLGSDEGGVIVVFGFVLLLLALVLGLVKYYIDRRWGGRGEG